MSCFAGAYAADLNGVSQCSENPNFVASFVLGGCFALTYTLSLHLVPTLCRKRKRERAGLSPDQFVRPRPRSRPRGHRYCRYYRNCRRVSTGSDMSDGHGWYISPLQGFAHGWITAPPGTAVSTSRPPRSLHMRALGTAVSAGTGERMAQPLPGHVMSGAGENLEVAVEQEQDHRIED